MQVHLDDRRGLVRDRSHVDVGLIAVAPDHLTGQLAQLLDRFIELDLEQRRRLHEALVVLGELEEVDLPVIRVPVAPNAFEAPGPVIERMRPDADLGVLEGDDRALEVGEAAINRLCGWWSGIGGVERLDSHQATTWVVRTISSRSRSRMSFLRSARPRNSSQARAKAASGRW